ncbi:MAG TPA: T9SS type A sorting domain-containing protein [Ignavibacteriaceae bacterium]|nr:T9SS type A sorting domain-containing protein [Ignavibacteriaceae bacterium]
MRKALLLILVAFTFRLYSQGYVCAIGGGSEGYNSWSDAPYSWIVEKSDSGKIIILGTNAATNWLPNYFISFGADTAYNKTINSRAAANLQETYDELITAKAIFIRGGDQWNYISLWKGTKLDSAINFVFNSGGVIAGTSAGQAVLGEVDFSAQNGTVYPDESLLNPFNTYMRFEDNFLNLVPNVLFDSHFIERGRHGRLIAMLYNRYFQTGRELIGIGVDDRTAFCISPDAIGEVMGSGAATIFTIDNETLFEPINAGNYTIESLKCEQLTKGWKYDLNSRQISYIPPSAKEVDTRREWELPLTDFWLTGSENISQHLQTNFSDFVANVNNEKFIVISHPGFSSQLTPITNYLSQHSLNYEVVYLNSSNLNDPTTAQVITSATNFVFTGDSLNILALLKDISTLAGQAFREKAVFFKTPIFFFGKAGKIAGQFYTDNLYTDEYAAYRGKMTNNIGLNLFVDMLFEPSLFDDSDYYENRMSSVLWGMMRNRKRFGIYLHGNAMAAFNSDQKSVKGYGTMPPIYIDASQTSWVDSSTFIGSGGVGPRQVVAMNDLRYSITTYDDNGYSIPEGRFESSLSVDDEANEFPYDYILYQNYPNPFNPTTSIQYAVSSRQFVSLIIYDILGNKIKTLVNEEKPAGTYEVIFDASQLTSGIYFYRLSTEKHSETKSMILLK